MDIVEFFSRYSKLEIVLFLISLSLLYLLATAEERFAIAYNEVVVEYNKCVIATNPWLNSSEAWEVVSSTLNVSPFWGNLSQSPV